MNQLITEDERRLLLEHGQARAAGRVIDPLPVVRLFTPDATPPGCWCRSTPPTAIRPMA